MKSIQFLLMKTLRLSMFAMGLVLLAAPSFATDITGYEDLIRIYGKGLSVDEQEAFRSSIREASQNSLNKILKAELTSTYAERQHIFRQSESVPTKIFNINNEYTAIGFEKALNYKGAWEKSAFMLLFKVKGPQHLIPTNSYLFWRSKGALDEYKNIEIGDLCQRFPELSVIPNCGKKSPIQIAKAAKAEEKKESPKPAPAPATQSPPSNPVAPAQIAPTPQKVQEDSSQAVIKLKKQIASMGDELQRLNAEIGRKSNKGHAHSGHDITSGIIAENFIDAAIARDRELTNTSGRVSYNEADETYVKGLENRIMELENTVKQLSDMLKGVYREQNTIVFSGVNLQVVNGSGSTGRTTNGLGNLIVGYNQPREGSDEINRTGSHNLIVGDGHNYSSYGGFVAGLSNTISGAYSSVLGGLRNVASGDYAAVSGGHFKVAEGVYELSQPDTDKSSKENQEKGGCFLNLLLGR